MSGALAKYLKDFSQFVPPEAPSAFDLDMPVSSFESDFSPSRKSSSIWKKKNARLLQTAKSPRPSRQKRPTKTSLQRYA